VLDTFEDTLKRAEKLVFLTGAGISQEGGISTFKGNGGLWQKYDPMMLTSARAFKDDPRLVWSWYNDRRRKILGNIEILTHWDDIRGMIDRQKEHNNK